MNIDSENYQIKSLNIKDSNSLTHISCAKLRSTCSKCCLVAAQIFYCCFQVYCQLVWNAAEWMMGKKMRAEGQENGNSAEVAAGCLLQADSGGVVGLAAPSIIDNESTFILGTAASILSNCQRVATEVLNSCTNAFTS